MSDIKPLSRVEFLIKNGGTSGNGFNDFMKKYNERYKMPLSELEEMLEFDYILDSLNSPIQDFIGRNIEAQKVV
jgi:hypothetical protein